MVGALATVCLLSRGLFDAALKQLSELIHMNRRWSTKIAIAIAIASALFALPLAVSCSGSDNPPDNEGGATGTTCSPGSTLTYDNFGSSFMASYCTRCHSSSLSGAPRQGAPDGHDFDSFAGILAVAEHIDEYAAAGPGGTNTEMPPTDPKPTLAERQELGEWLACEAMRNR